ncbi:MAG: hypothetical protein RR244_07730 [Oscillospiraceae bacterium]
MALQRNPKEVKRKKRVATAAEERLKAGNKKTDRKTDASNESVRLAVGWDAGYSAAERDES